MIFLWITYCLMTIAIYSLFIIAELSRYVYVNLFGDGYFSHKLWTHKSYSAYKSLKILLML